jgi:hypothetical protein
VQGRIAYRNGKPAGIKDASMAPLLGQNGRPLAARGWYDVESIADDGAILYVGIERVNQIVRFDFGKHGMLAKGEPIAVPAGLASLPKKSGLEALAFVPAGLPLAGSLIAISERGLDDQGNIRGFLIGGPRPGAFSLRRYDDFDVTSASVTPAGEVLVLERRISVLSGASMRIRSLKLSTLKAGALMDGPVLIEANSGYRMDNMEGLAVHRGRNGETVLTLVSDDNFSPIQRTVLLQFELSGEGAGR